MGNRLINTAEMFQEVILSMNQSKTFEAPKACPGESRESVFDFDARRIEWARLHILHLTKNHFFGKLTLIMEDGKIVRAIKEENLKP